MTADARICEFSRKPTHPATIFTIRLVQHCAAISATGALQGSICPKSSGGLLPLPSLFPFPSLPFPLPFSPFSPPLPFPLPPPFPFLLLPPLSFSLPSPSPPSLP